MMLCGTNFKLVLRAFALVKCLESLAFKKTFKLETNLLNFLKF